MCEESANRLEGNNLQADSRAAKKNHWREMMVWIQEDTARRARLQSERIWEQRSVGWRQR
jgi:hypothetical protein